MISQKKSSAADRLGAKRHTVKTTVKKSLPTQGRASQQLASKPIQVKLRSDKGFLVAVGRRKTAIARVRLFAKGSGQIIINGQELEKYFSLSDYINTVLQPLILINLDKSIDVRVKVTGGGKAGQAIAIRHGLSKALLVLDENYRKLLRPAGFLTRDARIKERKKPGLKKARRSPQFSKR